MIDFPTFVFFHVGHDLNVNLLVKSIKATNPNAQIIQCSDFSTTKIDGVTDIFRLVSDVNNLMTLRLEIFSKLKLDYPAIYIDTDMLILKEVQINSLLNSYDVVCCQRSFALNDLINISFRGMDLSEYKNKTLGEIYPIIACFTLTKNYEFWYACYENLLTLDTKFHTWYGDQEAMRNIINSNRFKAGFLPESMVACLPEFFNFNDPPISLHFKGAQRKVWMKDIFQQLFHTT